MLISQAEGQCVPFPGETPFFEAFPFTMSPTRNLFRLSRNRQDQRRGTTRNRSAFLRRPLLEVLDNRVLLTVGFVFSAGTAAFTGDDAGHTLILSETLGRLSYTDDSGLGLQDTSIPISSITAITINLGNGDNTPSLDSSWTFTDPVSFTGGAGLDTLDDSLVTGDTWHLTDANSGDINAKLTFESDRQGRRLRNGERRQRHQQHPERHGWIGQRYPHRRWRGQRADRRRRQ